MQKAHKLFSKKQGQMTVEMVLIIVTFVSILYLVRSEFDRLEPVNEFITGPWKSVAGMMESGIWKERGDAEADHPNQWSRMQTVEGDSP